MKVELSSIVDGIEFQGDESQSYLNKLSGEVLTITDEEMHIAESKKNISDYPEWMQEAITKAENYIKDQENYLILPTKYDLNEYRIMESFILTIPIEEQKNEMYGLIKGKGAFSKFKRGVDRFLLKDKWYEYRDNELSKFAKDWCEDNDIKIKPAPKT